MPINLSAFGIGKKKDEEEDKKPVFTIEQVPTPKINLSAFTAPKPTSSSTTTTPSSRPVNLSAFGIAPKFTIEEKKPKTMEELRAQNATIQSAPKNPISSFFKEYTPKIVQNAFVAYKEALVGRGQEVDLAGNLKVDSGALGFFRPLGIGKTDYERYAERADALMAKGVDPVRAGEIAVLYTRGNAGFDPIGNMEREKAQKSAIDALGLKEPEKDALRGVAFMEGLDAVFGALDVVSLGTTKVGRTAISQIAKSKNATAIEKILVREVPELAKDKPASKGLATMLTHVDDETNVEAVINRVEFSYRGAGAKGAAGGGDDATRLLTDGSPEARTIEPVEIELPKDTRMTRGSQVVSEETKDFVARERFNIPALQKISFGGSDRDVYDLGDDRVLKIAKSARGIAQNDAGIDYYAQDAGLIPRTFETGKNYVVSEKMNPPDANTKKMVAEMKKVDDANPIRSPHSTERLQAIVEVMQKYGYPGEDLLNYNVMLNDLTAIRNWGTTADGKPMLLDEGTLNKGLLDDYTERRVDPSRGIDRMVPKKNMDDPEFREGYSRSRAAKKKYGDKDSKTMYSAGAGAPAGAEEDEETGEIKIDPVKMAFGMFLGGFARKLPDARKLVTKSNTVPSTVYHGTAKGSVDKIAKEGFKPTLGIFGRAIYFAKDEPLARMYAESTAKRTGEEAGVVVEADVELNNTLEVDKKYLGLFEMAEKDPELMDLIRNRKPGEDPIQLVDYARSKGYDSIFAKDMNELVVFDDASITRVVADGKVVRDVYQEGADLADEAIAREKELEGIDDTVREYIGIQNAADSMEGMTPYRFSQLSKITQDYLLDNGLVPNDLGMQVVMGKTEKEFLSEVTPNADLFDSIRGSDASKKLIYSEAMAGEMRHLKENVGAREFSKYFRKMKTHDQGGSRVRNADENRVSIDEFASNIGNFSDRGTGGNVQAVLDEFMEYIEKRTEIKRAFDIQRATEKAEKASDAAKVKELKDIQKRVYTELTKKRYSYADRFRLENAAAKKARKAGVKQGWKEAKTAITNQLRNTFDVQIDALKRKGELDAFRTRILERMKARIRTEIVEYARMTLPVAERGKLIQMASRANTQRELIKAFTRIDKLADEYRRKTAISNLQKKVRAIEDSGRVAVDYKERVKDLVAGLDFKSRRADTIARLKKLEDFVEGERAAGRDVAVPERLLRALDILRRKPVKDLSMNEIQNMIETVELLEQLGKTKLGVIERLYEAEKARRMDALINEIRPIEKHPLIEAGFGENLTITQKFKNAFPTMLNMAQHVDLSLAPMDVFFDVMGGSPGTYESAPSRIFKAVTDTNYGRYNEQKDEIIDRVWARAEELKMTQKNFERIGVHAARSQKDGMEKLLNTGLTREQIDAVVLTEGEMEMYRVFREELDLMRPAIENTMRIVYNKPLGKVENYFSFMTDWDAMSETEVFQRIGQDVPEFGKPTKNVQQGFTKARTGAGKQKIKLDAMEIFAKHIDNSAYLVNMARDNKMLFEIANSPQFGAAAGDLGQKYTLQWIDLISRKGGKDGDQKIAILDTLRRNVGVAYLGFKLTSALIQPTALLDGASEIGTWAFRGAGEITRSRNVRQFLLANFPEIKARVGDDPAYLDLDKSETLSRIQNAGYAALKKLDGLTASSVAWGAYMKKLDELGVRIRVIDGGKEARAAKTPPGAIYRRKKGGEPLTQEEIAKLNKKAIEYAQRVVRNTQASSLFKDAPQAISRGNFSGNKSLDKALFQFQTFVLRRWYRIRHDAYRAGIKNRNFGKAFRIFFWLAMAYLAEEGIRRGSTELTDSITGHDSSEEPNRDGYTTAVAKSVLSTIPFVSQGISVAVYQSDPVPALGAIRTGLGGINRVATGASAETKTKGLIDLAESLGAAFGVPGTRQASQLATDAIDAKAERDKDPFGLDLDLDLDLGDDLDVGADIDLDLDLDIGL